MSYWRVFQSDDRRGGRAYEKGVFLNPSNWGRGPLRGARRTFGISSGLWLLWGDSSESARKGSEPVKNTAEPGGITHRDPFTLRQHPVYEQIIGSSDRARVLFRADSITSSTGLVTITGAGIVVDGHERWLAAERQHLPVVPCLELELSDDEALQMIIERHARSPHLNAFLRVVLALQLEPRFKTTVARQLESGESTGSPSNLTERVRRDARAKIAKLAGVSAGNVTKIRQILADVIPDVQVALRQGTVSIHQAWRWRSLPKNRQRDALWAHQHRTGIDRTIRGLLAEPAQARTLQVEIVRLGEVVEALTARRDDIPLFISEAPGVAVVITRELFERLKQVPA